MRIPVPPGAEADARAGIGALQGADAAGPLESRLAHANPVHGTKRALGQGIDRAGIQVPARAGLAQPGGIVDQVLPVEAIGDPCLVKQGPPLLLLALFVQPAGLLPKPGLPHQPQVPTGLAQAGVVDLAGGLEASVEHGLGMPALTQSCTVQQWVRGAYATASGGPACVERLREHPRPRGR